MRKLFILTFLLAALQSFAVTNTNTVASGDTALLIPGVIGNAGVSGVSTGRLDTAAIGAYAREGRIIYQNTANGWVTCPADRRLVVIQRLDGSVGTAVVVDAQGDVLRLDDTYVAVVFSGPDAADSPIWIRAEGGAVTVFHSYR